MSITYQCAWIHQLRKHLVEREEGIRLCTGGSVGEGTQEGHTEPSGSTWIGKETLDKCLCGDGHKAMRATTESPGMGPPKACVGQKQTAHLLQEILEV